MPNLLAIDGPDSGTLFQLTQALISIGRDRTNGICLNDSEASRKHAEIRMEPAGIRLVDTGSANGTTVNGRKVQDIFLQPGDRIAIGRSTLQLQMEAKSGSDSLLTHIVRSIPASEATRFFKQPSQIDSTGLKIRLANLSVMYDSSQAISRIVDIDDLLKHLMELIFRSIEADEGCMMLRGETGELEPKAIRRRNGQEIDSKVSFSRTIMEYVLREDRGILLSDAEQDERFQHGESIARFRLREVICVPMTGRHDTLGVLFLVTQSNGVPGQTVKFTEEHLSLAIALAHQAALAIEDTRYRQAMLQNERLAGIGQTIAAISHHVKNIMQGVMFGSDMVRSGLKDDDKTMLSQGWRLVEKNQKKIHDLVMDMLSYSKPRDPQLENSDINVLCAEVYELLQGRAKELNVDFQFEPNRALPQFPFDPDGLHKALLNIAGNAIDAVEETANPRVKITLSRISDEKIEIRVEDNGPGIPKEKLVDIFKPFVSTKGSRGTGLGLPVSQKILQEHHGDLIVQSEVGTGTTFVLQLPLKQPD
ncbi:FHA domain-containing protein [Telmatocola sphagniphila]|uniref:histidine kinase n=1 Tax=Telmatocola sphagniphila TaxID=1123043 RepID=A0A8E6B765_9BACT|nr:ATP-binding protein [Telmatocola sphagniphila]QVL32406.1 FHA domain-containing protein [Telmatocola sphagniphila]